MKKIIISLILVTLFCKNGFAMQDLPSSNTSDETEKGDKSSLIQELDNMFNELKNMSLGDKKEVEDFNFKMFVNSQKDRAEYVLNQELYLREYANFLIIEQLIIQKKDIKITEQFINFIVSKLDLMIDKSIPLLREGTIFANDPQMPLHDWVLEINRKSNLSLLYNFISLIYLKRILVKHPNIKLNVNNIYRLFFITYYMAAKFLEDENYINSDWVKVGLKYFNLDLIVTWDIEVLNLLDFNLTINDKELNDLLLDLKNYIKL